MANIAKIKDVTLFWASLSKENEMSGKYQVDLGDLSSKTVENLEAKGVTVHNKGDDRGFFVTAKSSYPINTYDVEGATIRGDAVGNGTKADVVVSFYDWTFKKTSGTAVGVTKLIVTDLQEYSADADDIDLDDLEEL